MHDYSEDKHLLLTHFTFSFDVDHVLASCHRVVWFSALFQDVTVCELICMISSLFLYQAVIVHIVSYTYYYYASDIHQQLAKLSIYCHYLKCLQLSAKQAGIANLCIFRFKDGMGSFCGLYCRHKAISVYFAIQIEL